MNELTPILENPGIIKTARTRMEVLGAVDAELILRFYTHNQRFLAPWEPSRNEDYYQLQFWQDQLKENRKDLGKGLGFKFAALNQDRTEVLAVCNFANVVYGVFQACHLGYAVAEKYQGQGIMQEVVQAGLDFVFTKIGLHRVMANYMPENTRSAALLERLGFEKEGLAKSYLKINGQWRDHILTSKVNPNSKY